nr:siderophore iron transporter mirb [Quercus suber]
MVASESERLKDCVSYSMSRKLGMQALSELEKVSPIPRRSLLAHGRRYHNSASHTAQFHNTENMTRKGGRRVLEPDQGSLCYIKQSRCRACFILDPRFLPSPTFFSRSSGESHSVHLGRCSDYANRSRPQFNRSTDRDMAIPKAETPSKMPATDDREVGNYGSISNSSGKDIIDTNAQAGVQAVEATTTAWTTSALVIAYILIWITYFVEGLLSGTQTALLPFVTSTFAEHSLTPTVSVVSSVIGGCTNFTIAKILDVFGRPQGFLICIVLGTMGLIMMAACRTVEAYAAAQVFYTVGNTGLQYTLSVFVADSSSLRNRGLMQAFAYSPNLITCWLAGLVSTAFLNGAGWPWAFGMFSILVPAATIPLYGLLQYQYLRAKKLGLVPKRESGRIIVQSIIHHAKEFDVVGLILLSAGVALFLLSFNLYMLQPEGWDSPLIICFIVFGVVLLGVFAVWEKFFAPVAFLPYSLLSDRTVLGACILSATLYFSYFCWFSFFSSFLQVVNDLSLTYASYVINIYAVGSVLASLTAGLAIHITGRFKPVCLYGGIPLNILGTGLMMYFRRPNSDIGYIVMCQIFIALASGVVIICDEVAILAAASHQHIAVTVATLGFFGNIGGSIGLTVTSAIWQAVFPQRLAELLPAEELPNLVAIYTDLTTQLSYPVGTPARTAIQQAYGDAQFNILIASTAVWVLGIAAVFLWRNIRGRYNIRTVTVSPYQEVFTSFDMLTSSKQDPSLDGTIIVAREHLRAKSGRFCPHRLTWHLFQAPALTLLFIRAYSYADPLPDIDAMACSSSGKPSITRSLLPREAFPIVQ